MQRLEQILYLTFINKKGQAELANDLAGGYMLIGRLNNIISSQYQGYRFESIFILLPFQ